MGVLLFARHADARADGVLKDLEKDRGAREVLGRVAKGGYGPGGRAGGGAGSSKDKGRGGASRSVSRSGSPRDADGEEEMGVVQ